MWFQITSSLFVDDPSHHFQFQAMIAHIHTYKIASSSMQPIPQRTK